MNAVAKLIAIPFAAAAFLASAGAAFAQYSSPLADSLYTSKHLITLGAASQTADATIAAAPAGSEGASISLRDLAIDNEDQTYYLEYSYRFKPRWALVAGTYQFSGSGGRETARDLEYNGVEFTTGSTIQSKLDIDAYIIDVLYRVYANERFEFMAGGGVHALDLGADIRGQVRINELESAFRQSGTTLLAPVPNLRAMALWKPADRFAVRLNGGWLSARVDDVDGAFTYAHLRGSWELTENFGLSLGYQWTDVDITEKRGPISSNYNVTLRGPTLTASYGF
jgi:hypothetical protein